MDFLNICICAVSYTHLDVYKRQLHIRICQGAGVPAPAQIPHDVHPVSQEVQPDSVPQQRVMAEHLSLIHIFAFYGWIGNKKHCICVYPSTGTGLCTVKGDWCHLSSNCLLYTSLCNCFFGLLPFRCGFSLMNFSYSSFISAVTCFFCNRSNRSRFLCALSLIHI